MRRPAKSIALILMGVLATLRPAIATTPVDLELALGVDVSGSVDVFEARLQRGGYVAALTDAGVIRAILSGPLRRIAVTYFEWAGEVTRSVVVGWALLHDAGSARRFAAAIAGASTSRGRFTSISGAIDFALPLFATNGFEGTRRVIDLSGDGPNNVGRAVRSARDAAVAAGITINGLPIVNERPNRFGMPMPNLDLYYRDCVIGGAGAFLVAVDDFDSFALAVRRKLILEIAGSRPREFEGRLATLDPKQTSGVATTKSYSLSANVSTRALSTHVESLVPTLARRASAAALAPPCDAGERRLRRRLRDWF